VATRIASNSAAVGTRRGIDLVGLGLALFGGLNVALGIWMSVDPQSFFTAIGPFGSRNDHYLRDNATFYLALGASMLAALRFRGWAAPLFALAALQAGLHAANHLNDIDTAHPGWVGPFDLALIVAETLVLALLCRRAPFERSSR
jgi:hypothetical protein